LVADTGVLLLPGAVYDEPDHVRIGYGRSTMPEALALLEGWIDTRS
jgi:aspartate/methionine/tyrosine aminotransferase